MRALAVVGWKDSGKTTLCADIASRLSERGFRVGIIKSSGHRFDLAGRDTSRFAESAEVVGGVGPEQSMLLWTRPKHILDLVPLMEVEVLLVEGGKSLGWLPRILVPRNTDDISSLQPDLAYGYWGELEIEGLRRFEQVDEVADLVLEQGFALPGLDCGQCGFADCPEMARAIVAGRVGPEDCKAQGPELSVQVNGQEIAMNPFVRNIIAGSIAGMLEPLKGVSAGQVQISMQYRPSRR